MSVTWEAYFVDEAKLAAVYGSNDEKLLARVEATQYFQFLVEQSANELAQNLEYAKKVAPREYEPLKRVDLDPARALRDIVFGRELRPMNVEFYDLMLWCVCDVIGDDVSVEYPGAIWDIEVELRDRGFPAPEAPQQHPYLPVPVVRRASVTEFSVWTPASCKKLLDVLADPPDALEDDYFGVEEWRSELARRDPARSLILFGL